MNHHHRLEHLERWAITLAQLTPVIGVLFVAFLIDTRHPANFINRPYAGLIAMYYHGLTMGITAMAWAIHHSHLVP